MPLATSILYMLKRVDVCIRSYQVRESTTNTTNVEHNKRNWILHYLWWSCTVFRRTPGQHFVVPRTVYQGIVWGEGGLSATT